MPSKSWSITVDTLSDWTGTSVHSFGELSGRNPGSVTYGQTFMIDEDAWLNSITFAVSDYAPGTADEPTTFEVYVTAWDGMHAEGPILYQSEPITTAGDYGIHWEEFVLDTGEVLLNADRQYVVFFTENNFLNDIRSDASMKSVENIYPDGSFVTHHSGESLDELFNENWAQRENQDLCLRLELTAVPEPTTLALFVLGLMFVAKRR
jgi:hypothetical protein